MAGERFPDHRGRGITDPPPAFRAISPDDDADLPDEVRAVYFGVGGDFTAIGVGTGEDPVTWVNVPQGATIVGRFRRILATGTTASSLVGYL